MMKNRKERVCFVGVNNVDSSACEPCEPALSNRRSPEARRNPKTSEYKFYKRTLEESCWKFGNVENAPAKLEQRNHTKGRSEFEKFSLALPVKRSNSSYDPSCSPCASPVVDSRNFNNCNIPLHWTFSDSPIMQNFTSKDSSTNNVTQSFPGTGSSIPCTIESGTSGMQIHQGEILSIKRRKLKILMAEALSISLDDCLSIGSEEIPKLLHRLGVEKDGCSFSLTVKSNAKHSNCGDHSDNYIGEMFALPRPKKYYHDPYDSDLNYTSLDDICPTEFLGDDAEGMTLFSSSNNSWTNARFDLACPKLLIWDTEELHQEQQSAHQTPCDVSDSASLAVPKPLYMRRNPILTERVCSKRPDCIVVDVPSDLVLVDAKGDPYFECHSPNQPIKPVHPKGLCCYTPEDVPSDIVLLDSNIVHGFQRNPLKWPLFTNDADTVQEAAGEEIIDPFAARDSSIRNSNFCLDGNSGNETTVDAFVAKMRVRDITPESSFMRWFFDFGVKATSSFSFNIPFNCEDLSSERMLFPEIALHDFNSNYSSSLHQRIHTCIGSPYVDISSQNFGPYCHMLSPQRPCILEVDHSSYDSLSIDSTDARKTLFQQEGTNLVSYKDNTFSCTSFSSKYKSRGLLFSREQYRFLPETHLCLENPLPLSSSETPQSSDVGSVHGRSWKTSS